MSCCRCWVINLFIAGISVAAGLVVGGISGGITYIVSKPSSELDEVDQKKSNTTIDNILIVNGFGT